MMPESTRDNKVACFSEYDTLKKVILCEPQFMRIKDIINETQKHFIDEGIHIETAMKQHKQFVNALQDYGVEVLLLPSLERYPEQVFTRDIGFTIGDTVFVAEMASKVRKGEENLLVSYLSEKRLAFCNLTGDRIEGGDVIIDRNTVYVGLSERTNEEAASHLQTLLPDFEVVPVPFTDKYLHLDCVFNIISPEEALIYPGEIHKEKLELLASRYDLIEISEEEQFTLGTNVLSIGNKNVFSLPVNKKVNKELRNRGYDVIEVDISEIIKSGGAFRCCTLPILRENH